MTHTPIGWLENEAAARPRTRADLGATARTGSTKQINSTNDPVERNAADYPKVKLPIGAGDRFQSPQDGSLSC